MGHDEAPVPIFRAASLKLIADGGELDATETGLKVSGSKVWFANGSTWEVITST